MKGDSQNVLDWHIARLGLSIRAQTLLEGAYIQTVRDLCRTSTTSLMCLKNFGPSCLKEVEQKLLEVGITHGKFMPSAAPLDTEIGPMRREFAGQAMAALIIADSGRGKAKVHIIEEAYQFADMMIAMGGYDGQK